MGAPVVRSANQNRNFREELDRSRSRGQQKEMTTRRSRWRVACSANSAAELGLGWTDACVRPYVILRLPQTACDRRYQEYFVAVLERIRSATQKANIFLVHINIQEPPRLPGLIPQVGL